MLLLQSYFVGFFIALLSWYGIYSWKRRRLYRMASKIPGPPGLPFIGEALSAVGSDHTKAFRNLTNLAKDYETPTKIWYGPYCAIILDNAKDLQVVLTSPKCMDKAVVYKFIGLRKGLIVAGGNLWKTHRQLLDPSFKINILQSFQPIFNEKSKILVHELDKRVGQSDFDVFTQISACTLETLLVTMMGISKDVQSDAYTNKYLHDVEMGTKLLNDRLFKVWLQFEPLFRLSSGYELHKKYVENGIFAIAHEVLKEKNQKRSENASTTKNKIFIDQLLSGKDFLAEDEIVDEINTLIGAVSLAFLCIH